MPRRSYRYKSFQQKVSANKSPRWFKEKKKELEQSIFYCREAISSLTRLKEMIPTQFKVTEAELISRFANKRASPPTGLRNLFSNREDEEWKSQLEGLKKEIRSHQRQFFSRQEISRFLVLHNEYLNEPIKHISMNLNSISYQPTLEKEMSLQISEQKATLRHRERDLEILLPKYEKIMAIEARKQSDKSLIARSKKKSRDLADQIKRKLEKSEYCPYCERTLGPSPHADHIYPLAHGGQETVTNMIYVCEQCNLKKSDKTLLEFSQHEGYDYMKIVARLQSAGKKV